MEAAAKSAPKPLIWMADSRETVKAFPAAVKNEIGFALYQAQTGYKHIRVKASEEHRGWGDGSRIRSSWRYVSRRIHSEAGRPGLCTSCLPEEIEDRHCDAKIRD
jgi:hypothetical protein